MFLLTKVLEWTEPIHEHPIAVCAGVAILNGVVFL